MKALTTTLILTLLMSMGAWADMDKPYDKLRNHKAEAIHIETGYKFYVGRKSSREEAIFESIVLCDDTIDGKSLISKSGSRYNAMLSPEWKQKKCVISRVDKDNPRYTDLNDYLTCKYIKKLFISKMINNYVDCLWQDNDGKASPMACAQQRDFGLVVKFRQNQADTELIRSEAEEIYEKESKEVIFTALFDRCSEFGWISEDDISACIKQEAYRDLQMQEQQYEMRLLEERLAYTSTPEPSPNFLEILNQYAQIKQTQQMQKDIRSLKASNRSMRSRQNTQSALKFLYQGRSD